MIYRKGLLPSVASMVAGGLQKTADDLIRYLNDQDANLESILVNGFSFEDNFDGSIVEYTTSGAEDTIPHGLRRIPTGWIVTRKAAEFIIWESGTAFDETNIYLQASLGTQPVTVLIF